MSGGLIKGTAYLTAANLCFFLSGYAIHFGLGRYLGPEDYGLFGVVLALMNVATLILVSGFPDAASRYIAQDTSRLRAIVQASRRIQLTLSVVLFACYLGLATVIADLLRDSDLVPYIVISAFAIPLYALYNIYYAGYLNGLRRFGQQAVVLTATSVARVGLVFGLVIVGLGVRGAIIGYLAAAVIGFILAWRFLGSIGRTDAPFRWTNLVSFGVPATLFSVALFLLMNVDLFAVKAIRAIDSDTGYYTAAAAIAKIPYFLFAALPAVLLPTISNSTSANDKGLTAQYIRQSLRYTLMFIVPMALLISATSDEIVTLVYSSQYIAAGASLSILILGLAFLTVFLILASIAIGGGKPNIACAISLPLVAIDIVLSVFLVSRYGLPGAAWATTITAFAGMTAMALYVLKHFGALVNIASVIKVSVASVSIAAVAFAVPEPYQLTPVLCVGLMIAYLFLLWAMREIDSSDLTTLRSLFSSRLAREPKQ